MKIRNIAALVNATKRAQVNGALAVQAQKAYNYARDAHRLSEHGGFISVRGGRLGQDLGASLTDEHMLMHHFDIHESELYGTPSYQEAFNMHDSKN